MPSTLLWKNGRPWFLYPSAFKCSAIARVPIGVPRRPLRARNEAGPKRKLVPPRLHLHVSRALTGRRSFRHLANATVP